MKGNLEGIESGADEGQPIRTRHIIAVPTVTVLAVIYPLLRSGIMRVPALAYLEPGTHMPRCTCYINGRLESKRWPVVSTHFLY